MTIEDFIERLEELDCHVEFADTAEYTLGISTNINGQEYPVAVVSLDDTYGMTTFFEALLLPDFNHDVYELVFAFAKMKSEDRGELMDDTIQYLRSNAYHNDEIYDPENILDDDDFEYELEDDDDFEYELEDDDDFEYELDDDDEDWG